MPDPARAPCWVRFAPSRGPVARDPPGSAATRTGHVPPFHGKDHTACVSAQASVQDDTRTVGLTAQVRDRRVDVASGLGMIGDQLDQPLRLLGHQGVAAAVEDLHLGAGEARGERRRRWRAGSRRRGRRGRSGPVVPCGAPSAGRDSRCHASIAASWAASSAGESRPAPRRPPRRTGDRSPRPARAGRAARSGASPARAGCRSGRSAGPSPLAPPAPSPARRDRWRAGPAR